MKKDLGDHIGKKKGWAWYELAEIVKIVVIKWLAKPNKK